MKTFALLIFPFILLASNTKLESELQQLQNEIKTLKAQVNQNSNDIEVGSTILEETETKTILDKINFKPELLLRFDKMDYKSGKIEGENTTIDDPNSPLYGQQRRDEFSKNFAVASTVRFRLNMGFELEALKFHGRLLYMNSTQAHERLCILSRDIKTGTAGSAIDMDRAYVDYTPNKNSDNAFTFSFGVLPTTGGTPIQYSQNRPRGSLFPALVFDMNTYGLIGTQKLFKDTFVRLVLAKPYTLRPQFYPYQCNRENIDHANIVGLYSDTKFNFLGGNSLLSFGVNMLHDLQAHPYLGPDVNSEDSHNLGTMVTFGLGMDINNVAHSDATLFLHTALSNPYANGNIDDYQIDANGTGFTDATYATGEMLSSNGYAVYLGTKYNLTPTFFLGAEYNYGSKYWFAATQGAEDMFNKLAIRGNVYEVYGTWKFQKYLNAKLGYLNMHEDYTGSGWHFGEPAKKDATQNIGYLSLEARF